MNNFTLIENQYVYQQGNPFLLNETNDALQLLGTYKTLSFSASYNYIRNTATTALARHETKADVLLKRVISIPSYSTLSLGLDWRDSLICTPKAAPQVQWLDLRSPDAGALDKPLCRAGEGLECER